MSTTPMASNLTAPLPPKAPLPRPNYMPPEETRQQLPRVGERGSLFPSDEARQQMPRASDRAGVLFPAEEPRTQLSSRSIERAPAAYYPSEQGIIRTPLSRGADRGIFLTSDDHALARQIEQQHRPDGRIVNVRPLFLIVEEIIYRATQTVEGSSLAALQPKEALEGRLTLNGLEEVPDSALVIERISCEVTCKLLSGSDPHNTTLSVLNLLPHFTWEAKVVLALAAFALTFGDFWLLVQIYSTNPLAKSMALIKRLPTIVEHSGAFRTQFDAINNLIRTMLETTKCIVEFGELPAMYISDDDPEVKAALAHFPIAVYWIIRSSVAAATQITTLSSRGYEYVQATAESWELSNWAHKLKTICEHLRNTLNTLYKLIDEKREVDSYNMIKKIIYQTVHIDNMKVLKVLISINDEVPPLYDGSTKKLVHLDTLRRKNVLLLISSLDISQEELYILEQSYTETKMHAYEIVWVPVADSSMAWTDATLAQFKSLQASMPWYSVHHPNIIQNAVIRFFRDDWNFKGKPILVVLDPHGKVVSPNAIHMMWIWQSHAFPFTSTREEILWEQEIWRLELLVNGIDPTISDWIREGKYIFLYGGDDIEWIRKFTKEAHTVAQALRIEIQMVYVGKSHHKEAVRKLCATIALEQLSHCWQDPAQVWYYWTRIESMIHSKIQLGKVNDHGDIILQEIQRIHSHDRAHAGWAILAKGSHIVVHGHGRLTLVALQQFAQWQQRAATDGFEVAYAEYYKQLYMKENPCHRIDFPSNVKLPKSMLCPDCRRYMQLQSSFICCHEDTIAEIAAQALAAGQHEP